MDPEQSKKKRRITNVTAVFMVVVAIIMDFLGPIGTVGGTIIFFIWFTLLNIPLIGPKQLVRWGLNLVGEVVTAGVWTGMTVGILLMIGVTRAEDKLGIDVLGKIPIAKKIGNLKDLERMKNKAVRRIQNPQRTRLAEERLQRMRQKGINIGKPAPGRIPMQDITVPKVVPPGGNPQALSA